MFTTAVALIMLNGICILTGCCLCGIGHHRQNVRAQNNANNPNNNLNGNLNSIQHVYYDSVLNADTTDNVCSICIDSLKENVHMLKCGHKFHLICIQKWYTTLVRQRRPITCPDCRDRLS